MIWFLILTFCCYAFLLLYLTLGFIKVKDFKAEQTIEKTSFSVVIPFRNEAKNLEVLLESILKLNYPKELVEFIFVDDASTDTSVELINSLLERNRAALGFEDAKPNIQIIKNIRTSNSPKKDAITTAILEAKNRWIVTTDADCKVPENWLKTLNSCIQKEKPKMVVAPVNYEVKDSFFEKFQLLDFLSLQGATIGGFGVQNPFLCNGANLAYQKTAFLKLNGFDGNNAIASGDDIFLFEKFINSNKKSVCFLKSKEAIVTTFPVKNWSELIHQRVRWAAKSGSYNLPFSKLVGLIIFLTNMSLVVSFLSLNLFVFCSFLILKLLLDLSIFLPTIHFFTQRKGFGKYYLQAAFLYPFFSVFVVLKAVFFNYTWKDRSFKK